MPKGKRAATPQTSGAEMTAPISFVVLGEPKGKGRPRFVRKTGHAYTDAQTASYENLIHLACLAVMCAQEPLQGPVAVTITAIMRPPSSASKKRLAAMLGWETYPTKKPDMDNIVKAVMDGMTGVAFRDDAQVVNLTVYKRWGAEPRLDVTFFAIEQNAVRVA
jgi:Holliday junction resolvase RusA-like endonuclease